MQVQSPAGVPVRACAMSMPGNRGTFCQESFPEETHGTIWFGAGVRHPHLYHWKQHIMLPQKQDTSRKRGVGLKRGNRRLSLKENFVKENWKQLARHTTALSDIIALLGDATGFKVTKRLNGLWPDGTTVRGWSKRSGESISWSIFSSKQCISEGSKQERKGAREKEREGRREKTRKGKEKEMIKKKKEEFIRWIKGSSENPRS